MQPSFFRASSFQNGLTAHFNVDPSSIAEAFWNYDYTKIFENSVSQEAESSQQRRRRKCADEADRQRVHRDNEKDEQRTARLEANAKRQQRRRQKEKEDTQGSCQEIGTTHRQAGRNTEDEEKRIARLEANARRQRLRRENETAEERAARLRANALRQRKRRQQETPEERAARLQANAQRQQRLRLKAVSPGARSAKQETELPSLPTLLPQEQNVCLQAQQPPLPYPFTISCEPNHMFTCQQ